MTASRSSFLLGVRDFGKSKFCSWWINKNLPARPLVPYFQSILSVVDILHTVRQDHHRFSQVGQIPSPLTARKGWRGSTRQAFDFRQRTIFSTPLANQQRSKVNQLRAKWSSERPKRENACCSGSRRNIPSGAHIPRQAAFRLCRARVPAIRRLCHSSMIAWV